MRYNGRWIEALRNFMVIRCPFLLATASSLIVSASFSCLAAPAGRVTFIPPLASARTIQVTETVWEAAKWSHARPAAESGSDHFLHCSPGQVPTGDEVGQPSQSDRSSLHLRRNNAGRIRWQADALPAGATRRMARSLSWAFLNNIPGPVSAVPATRGGRHVLLANSVLDGVREEYWFDPKTHLLLRSTLSGTWQGKTTEVMRTEYAEWVLNKPLPPALFRVPPAGTTHSGASL